MSVMRRFFFQAPASSVASDVDIVKRDRGDSFDWIRELFLDLYYLSATQSVSAKI